MYTCCNSNGNVWQRSNYNYCGTQLNYGCNSTNTTTQNSFNGVFGYFIPVNVTNGNSSCNSCGNQGGTARVSCGNGTYVTVSCGRRRNGCGCNNGTNFNTTNGDCYYARQYGLNGNGFYGCNG